MKPNKKISVLIPFLNEGAEVGRTVRSARETAGALVDIIVLNDASNDGYDYADDLKGYDVKYHINEKRAGSSAGKQQLVDMCETPYFLLLDAHSRIYTADWVTRAERLFDAAESENTLYCCACSYFREDDGIPTPGGMTAYGAFLDYNIKSIFSCAWNLRDFSKEDGNAGAPFEVPAILGANYLCRRDFWQRIGGYRGLRLYGREEAFISMKARMAGGIVKCFPAINTGHRERVSNRPPYTAYISEIVHNEMAIAYICAPHLYERLLAAWESLYSWNPAIMADARKLFESHTEELQELREQFAAVQILNYADFDAYNAAFQKRVGFSFKRLREQNKGTYTRFGSTERKQFPVG